MGTWYEDNKEYSKKYQKEYKSTPEFKQLRKKYDKKNHDHLLELKYQWRKNNPERYKIQKKKDDAAYYTKHKDTPQYKKTKSINHAKYYQENIERISEYSRKHQQIPEVKERRNETSRIRRRKNPQSNRRGTIELQIAMNNVRIRDKQTCQWQNCNLTFREVPIHVHHIFPTNEYPEYETVEKYMICYCANHHGFWHRYRGDNYSEFIGSNVDK